MTQLILTILIGFCVGLIAKVMTPGSGPGGFFLTAALGILGSFVATYLGQMFGLYAPGHSAGFLASVVGAAILLLAHHVVTKRLA